MQTLHFSITINAPVQKVWHTMLDDKTYRLWTAEFGAGSHFIGDWSLGSKMLFLGSSENGIMGMVSRIKENRQYEFMSIEHMGLVENGKEDTTSDAAKAWQGAHENYTFTQVGDITKVQIDIDVADEFKEMFEGMWPKALAKLKEIAEKTYEI